MKCDESKKKLFEFHQAVVKKCVDANVFVAQKDNKKRPYKVGFYQLLVGARNNS